MDSYDVIDFDFFILKDQQKMIQIKSFQFNDNKSDYILFLFSIRNVNKCEFESFAIQFAC